MDVGLAGSSHAIFEGWSVGGGGGHRRSVTKEKVKRILIGYPITKKEEENGLIYLCIYVYDLCTHVKCWPRYAKWKFSPPALPSRNREYRRYNSYMVVAMAVVIAVVVYGRSIGSSGIVVDVVVVIAKPI